MRRGLTSLGSIYHCVSVGIGVIFKNEGEFANAPPGIGRGVLFLFTCLETQMLPQQDLSSFEANACCQAIPDSLLVRGEGTVVNRPELVEVGLKAFHLGHHSRVLALLGGGGNATGTRKPNEPSNAR